MFKILKHLKPFSWLLLLSVALLFSQAMCDLALPNYMSNIVNVGIQQNGVEDAVPTALREPDYQRLMLFMNQEEQSLVHSSYTLLSPGSGDYAKSIAAYPAVNGNSIYVLSKLTDKDRAALDAAFSDALVTASSLSKLATSGADGQRSSMMADPSTLSPQMQQFMMQYMQVAATTDIVTALQSFDDGSAVALELRSLVMDRMDKSLVPQMAIPALKTIYTAMGVDMPKLQSDYIWTHGGWMLLISLASGACSITLGLVAARIGAGLARNLRFKLFRKVMSFSNAEFDRFSQASLITRSTNDITQVQMIMMFAIRMVIYAPIMGVGGVIYATQKSVSMTWIIALAVVVLLSVVGSIFMIARPRFKIVQKLVDRLNLIMRENLSGMMVIRAFRTQKSEEKRFDATNEELTKTNLFINRIMTLMMPAMMMIMNGTCILIMWVGAQHVADSAMQVGDIMAYIQYTMQIVMSFLMLSMVFIMLPRASVSASRIAEVIDTEPEIVDPKQPKHLPHEAGALPGKVVFDEVEFMYEGAEQPVLQNISFTAAPGETTAFIGATGSGKSTIINLLPRFYDVNKGSITIDGIDIRELTQHELRENISFVSQKAQLFSGTVGSNMALGLPGGTEEQFHHAIDIAQAKEFVDASAEGLDAPISQGGINISGGQKQRLAIARALAKSAPILIFDDSFSALDFKTDAALRNALSKEMGDKTVLIVAQRVGTIRHADQIIVLDEGRIVARGTHDELMRTCDEYQEIAMSQLSKEELA